MLKRSYLRLLDEYINYFPCIAILGPRQCGKTTLVHSLQGNWSHYDLESHGDFDQISHDPGLFFRSNPDKITIDEAQLHPPLFAELRVAIDRDRSKKGRFVITGSSSPELLKSISETLAGRVGIIEMAPLSFREAHQREASPFFNLLVDRSQAPDFLQLASNATLHQIENFWLKGGYPEPWVENNDRFREVWMEQYFRTYLERDIAKLFPGLDTPKFRLFLQTLASLNGRVINYSEVARSIGVSQPTARDYFQIAHGTFVWRQLPAYEKNALKRIVKHPKGYYRDSGLLNHMLRIKTRRDLLSHPDRGNMWESVVIEEVLRGLFCLGASFDYYYYRTGAGAEIDLMIEGSFGLIPIEIKQGQSVEAKSLRNIKSFVEERGCSLGIVINNDERVRLYSEKIVGIPFAML